jgi:hypothetical protein
MRTTILLLLFFLAQAFAIAQENWGKITFGNLNIPRSDGAGTYNVPLRDESGAGIGSKSGGATLQLFLPDPTSFTGISSTPFAIASMGTTSTSSPYTIGPAQTVTVPGYAPGSRAVIIIRTSGGEWIFTSLPLGGMPSGGGPEIPTPGLTGWGPEDGSGITVTAWPPSTRVFGPSQGAVFAAPATIQISATYGGDPGCNATNFAVYAGPILVASEILHAGEVKTYTTPPLSSGTYALYSVVSAGYGYGEYFTFTGTTQSIPINIIVVDPIDVSLKTPSVANGQLKFQYAVNPGLTYTIKASSDLKTWQTIETNKPASSPAFFSRSMSGTPATFYQVQRMPNP